MLDIGRICIKKAGREAGMIAVIVKKVDETYVLIDGNVKRRKCNIAHLEPSDNLIKIKEDESTEGVHKSMQNSGIKVISRKTKKEKKPLKVVEEKSSKVKNAKKSK